MKKLISFFAAITVLFSSVNLNAQTTKTWAGGTSTAWATAANWSPSGVPASTDHVVFNGTGTFQPTLDANRTVANITVTGNTVNLNSKVLTVTGATTLTRGTVNSGTISFTNSTTTFGGTTFGAKVKVSATNVYFNGSTFNGVVDAIQSGGATNSSLGRNTFNDSLKLKATGGGTIIMHSSSSNDSYNGYVSVSNSACPTCSIVYGSIYFGSVSGTGVGTLASGKTVTIGSSGFAGGVLGFIRFTQSGSTAQSLTLTSNAQLKLGDKSGATLAPTTWNGNVTFSSPNILIENSTFNGTASITKTGSSSNTCNGNNTFASTCTYAVTSTGYLTLANITGDTYNGNVNYNLSSTGLIYPANVGGDVYKGNIAIATNNQNITFANGTGGTVTFTGTTAQAISKTGTGVISIKTATINKASNDVTLSTPIKITSGFTFTSGKIISTSTNILTFIDNATATSASNTSYVQGPVAKEGNDAFTFPVGKNSMYRSLVIAAPTNTATVFTAEYFNSGQTLGTPTDTSLSNFSTCEYWTLTRGGSSDNVNVTPSWNSSSCNGAKATNMRAASWNGSTWLNLGNGARTGSNTAGTVTTGTTPTAFNAFTLANKTCTYAATITPTGATSFCSGGSVILTANSSKYYKWSTNAITQAITPTTGATYSVTVRDTSGCKGTANQVVTVWSLPTVNVGADTAIVKGDTLHLHAIVTGGTSPYSYLWSPSAGLSNTTIYNPLAYPDTFKTYIVRVTDTHGCIKRDTIKVWSLKISFTMSNDTIEAGDSIVFTNTSILAGGTTYYWDFGDCNYLDSTYHNWDRCKVTIVGAGSAKYFYDTDGSYEVNLRVMGPLGYFLSWHSPVTSLPIGPGSGTSDCALNCTGNFNAITPPFHLVGPGQLSITKSCWGNIKKCLFVNGSPDLFHSSGAPTYDVPANEWGAEANNGSSTGGYVGIIAYKGGGNINREYINSKLITPLAPGQSVELKMKVSLSDCSNFGAELQVVFSENRGCQANLGLPVFTGAHSAYLTDAYYNYQYGLVNNANANNVITTKSGWETITINYTNNTGQTLNYVTIGNFHDDATTQLKTSSNAGYISTNPSVPCIYGTANKYAYYYIDDITVNTIQCCIGSTTTLNNRTASSVLSDIILQNNGYVSGTTLTNNYNGSSSWPTIVLNGTFTINVPNFKFDNCNVVLSTNSKIIIDGTIGASNVIIEDSWFHACEGYLWDGIYINSASLLAPNTTLTVTGSKFEDAKNSIVSNNGGPYTISTSTFDKNYKHILVNSYPYNHAATIKSSNLISTTTLRHPFNQVIVDTKTKYGIELNKVRFIKIGDESNSTYRNYFSNAIYGIKSTASQVKVKNSTFENFNSFNLYTVQNVFESFGILSDGNFYTFSSLDVQSPYPAEPTANKFLNCVAIPDPGSPNGWTAAGGIYSSNYIVTNIAGNYFENVYTGVYLQNHSTQNIVVNYNEMNNVGYGIFATILNNTPTNIEGNNIYRGTTYSSTYKRTGIYHNATFYPTNSTNHIVIKKNELQNFQFGIFGQFLNNGSVIDGNLITVLPSLPVWVTDAGLNAAGLTGVAGNAVYGIYAQNGNNVWTINNRITGMPTGQSTTNLGRFEGIRLISATKNTVKCNSINTTTYYASDNLGKLGRAIMFEQPNNGSELCCNSLGNSYLGLGLINNGNIGNQIDLITPSDNIWLNGPVSPNGTLTNDTYTFNTIGSSSPFFVRNTANFLPPNNFTNINPQQIPFTNNSNLNAAEPCTCPIIREETGTASKIKTRCRSIIRDTTTYPIYDAGTKYLDNEFLYKLVKQYPDSIAGDTVIEDYVDSLDGTNIGAVYTIQQLLNTDFYGSPYTIPDTVFVARDSTEFNAQWFVPDSSVLANANSLLGSLTPSNYHEETYKVLYTIMADALQRIYFPDSGKELTAYNLARVLTSGQIDTLIYYADKCELEYGDGVFYARALLMDAHDSLLYRYQGYLGTCVPDSGGMRLAHFDENIPIESTVKIYPNPTNGNVFVQLPKDVNRATIQVFNTLGVLMQNNTVTGPLAELSLHNYTNGLYIIRIFDSSGKEIESKKVSLQR